MELYCINHACFGDGGGQGGGTGGGDLHCGCDGGGGGGWMCVWWEGGSCTDGFV